jgi:esterase/lipase
VPNHTHIEDRSFRLAGGCTGFLLIHGLGGTPVEMRYIAQGLARAGYTVHVPQLAGHCGSVENLKAAPSICSATASWQGRHWHPDLRPKATR